jgi:hypothetical protein
MTQNKKIVKKILNLTGTTKRLENISSLISIAYDFVVIIEIRRINM